MRTDRQRALLRIGRYLQTARYRFTTPTPQTHRRILSRRKFARDLRDIFGWNREFDPDDLPVEVMQALTDAEALAEGEAGGLRATVRFSSWKEHLLAHSGFPTEAADAVFFGPDSYRFARFIEEESKNTAPRGRILDLGCGTGIGGMAISRLARDSIQLVVSDVNGAALDLAEVNFELARIAQPQLALSDLFTSLVGLFDLVLANPPYLNDAMQRLYRHGGGGTGEALSLRILQDSLSYLAPGGRLLLYTGVAVSGEEDEVTSLAQHLADTPEWEVRCEDIDVDVFGEELEAETYAAAERIAVLGIVVRRAR
jgi:SAM-dependent methyltransferase